jgi:hypothetical protein
MFYENVYDLLVNYLFPPFILILGLVGNIFSLILLLSDKDLINIGPKDTYIYLFISDTLFLIQIIEANLQYTYNYDLTIISNLSCKLWYYINYVTCNYSTWLVLYISLDRFISIKYPARRFTLRKTRNQLFAFLVIIIINSILFIPIPFYFDLVENDTITDPPSLQCNFYDLNAIYIVSYLDLTFRLLIPFLFMVLITIILIYTLIESRRRIITNFLPEQNQTFNKEIKLAVSSICLNLIYILTQAPISFTDLFCTNNCLLIVTNFTYYLSYLYYGINFYIILLTNTLFRSSFCKLLISLFY